jgi:hypothetical protein
MNVFPSSSETRRYIPPKAYAALVNAQQFQILIGECLIGYSEDGIKQRIRQLDQLEAELGFVYVGEKQWLSQYLESGKSSALARYYYWVKNIFFDVMRLAFSYADYSLNPHLPSKVWKADVDGSVSRLGYEALFNAAYSPIEELELLIFGNEQGMSPTHAIKAFEFIHDLEYILAAMPSGQKERAPLLIEGLEVTNEEEPTRWELNVISEYGSSYNQTIVNRYP